jgi:hypothetical protein
MKNKILECALRSILNPKCQDCQSNLKILDGMESIGINHAIVLYEDDGLHMDVVEKDVCITYFYESCYEPHKVSKPQAWPEDLMYSIAGGEALSKTYLSNIQEGDNSVGVIGVFRMTPFPHIKICQQCGKREISHAPSMGLCKECKEKIRVI